MVKCEDCGAEFDTPEAREVFRFEFGKELDYDEYGAGLCGGCAISLVGSAMNRGRAIMMVNGEEGYNDDFVEKYL